jgi:DNA polymerase III delta prime subunit
MKTAREIRSGLDLSREKKVPCRTIQIEDEIKKRIIENEGSLLTEDERNAIVQKEEKRIRVHNHALTKARRKILRRKEATSIVQAVRRGDGPKKTDEINAIPGRKRPQEKKEFHAIDVSY